MKPAAGPPPGSQGLVESGERLRKVRKERYLSLVQAAARVGSSKAVLSGYERGEVLMPMALAERLDGLSEDCRPAGRSRQAAAA